jgi:surface protein
MPNSSNKININGTWHSISDIKINIDDAWKAVDSAYINTDGVWSSFWSSGTDYGDKFVFTIQTVGSNDTFTFPLVLGGTYNFTVNWGDNSALSTITAYNDADITHTYATEGVYQIECEGTINRFRFANAGDRLLVRDVKNWGSLQLGATSGSQFQGCSNMTVSAIDSLDVSGTSNFNGMFNNCPAITTIKLSAGTPVGSMANFFYGGTALTSLDLSVLNMSSVTSLSNAFYQCVNLTSIGNISGWNTGNINAFDYVFYNCRKLNTLDVSNWDTSKITTFYRAFTDCRELPSLDCTDWNVGEVTTFSEAFSNCYLLTTIGSTTNWNTSKCTTFNWMFHNNYVLHGIDVSGWDAHLVTSINAMFANNWAQETIDVSNWVTTALVTADEAFYHCHIITELDVSNWSTPSLTVMSNMFISDYSLTSLDLSGFDVADVTTFYALCDGCTNLTTVGNISGWNTGSATTFALMFRNCPNLTGVVAHNWDIVDVTAMNQTFYGSNNAISNSEYDAILTGWSSQTTPRSNVAAHFGDARYINGAPSTARSVLTGTYNWTITDGGVI